MEIKVIAGRGFDSNIYVVMAEDEAIIIDTGTGRFVSETIGYIKNTLNARTVKRIVLTHMHFDHSGGAQVMAKEFNVDIYIHQEDAKVIAEGNGVKSGAILFGGKLEPLPVKTLSNGDKVMVGNTILEVIHCPGHTPGSIALYSREYKALFCGDLIFSDGGVGRWDLPGGDFALLKSSISKISKLQVNNLYPGHGPVVEGGGTRHIKMALQTIKDYERYGI